MDSMKMALGALAILVVLGGLYYFSNGTETSKGTFTPSEKREIEKIVHDYLINEPEVLVKASQELQRKSRQQQMETALAAISENKEELLDEKSPFIGNPEGDIILIKFMDYQCVHCKNMEKVVEELIQENPNLKVIIKELPILGQPSLTASKAALAAAEQGKFAELHKALLSEKERLNDEKVLALAKQLGLDIDKLKKDMEAEAVDQEIKETYNLARKMAIQATPFFVVMANPEKGNEAAMILPGAVPKEHLQALINKVQGK
jgi:protein-disulfide isomerase